MKIRELTESSNVQTISRQELASLIKRYTVVTFANWAEDDYDEKLYVLTDLPPHVPQSSIQKLLTTGMNSREMDILKDFELFVAPMDVKDVDTMPEHERIDVSHTTWQDFYNAKIQPLLHKYLDDDFEDEEV